MSAVRVGVFGAGGGMGREVIRAALESGEVELAGAYERADSPRLGTDAGVLAGAGACGVLIAPESELAAARLDAVIDFSVPSASLRCAAMCRKSGAALVSGVTGFTVAEKRELEDAGADIAVVIAPNMSLGVHAMARLIREAAILLGAGRADSGFDMEILEAHHRRKRDAPSGTALFLGEVLASAVGSDLERSAVFTRRGRAEKRRAGEIGFAVVRGGDVAGEHRVMFLGDGEILEVSHRAGSRKAFALGAARAALFAARAEKGVYGMADVLAR